MRLSIVVGVVIGTAWLGATPGLAQPVYPWCLKADMGAGAVVDLCYFANFERCAQERFLYGTTSFCIINPHYYFGAKAHEWRTGKLRRRGER